MRHHTSGAKKMHHSIVREIELVYQALVLPGDVGMNLNAFTAAPDSPAQQALRFLASWADSHESAPAPSRTARP